MYSRQMRVRGAVVDLAVVGEADLHLAGQPGVGEALDGQVVLLRGVGDPDGEDTVPGRGMERRSSPTGEMVPPRRRVAAPFWSLTGEHADGQGPERPGDSPGRRRGRSRVLGHGEVGT
jgi:hypothetical protein